jgi:hypothetical protein
MVQGRRFVGQASRATNARERRDETVENAATI